MLKRLILAIIITFAIVCLHVPPAQAVAGYSKLPDPVPNVKIDVKLHIGSIQTIDTNAENWAASGYLVYSWKDSRVKDGVYDLSAIWHPAIEFVNAAEFTLIGSGATAKDGVVTAQERIRFVVSSGFELARFPFDTQELELHIESLQSASVRFENAGFTLAQDKFSSLSEWDVSTDTASTKLNVWPPDGLEYSRLTYKLKAKRNATFYINKILLPITALTGASFLVFLLPIEEFGTMISIAMTTILASLTLWLLTGDAVAKTAYSSILDYYVFWSLAHNGAVLASIVLLHRLIVNKAKRSRLVFRIMRFALPLTYLLATVNLLRRI